ncbi:hypothetical protein T08_14608 [Trichinella sp. T8]|nr:hypothetical protein T08_14608 [Trichinella sp. T8]
MKTDKYKIAISAILDLFHVGYSNLKHCCNFVISMTAIQLLWTETILSMIDFSWYGRCSKTSKLENSYYNPRKPDKRGLKEVHFGKLRP